MAALKRADFQARWFPFHDPALSGGLFVLSLHSAHPCPTSSLQAELVPLYPSGQSRVHKMRTCKLVGAFPAGLGKEGLVSPFLTAP